MTYSEHAGSVSPGELVLRRVLPATAVGAAAIFAGAVGGALVAQAVPCQEKGWGCLGRFLVTVVAALGVAIVMAWPLLHAVGVRPAVGVAACGPLASMVFGWFFLKAGVYAGPWEADLFLDAALGYGVAAFVTAKPIAWPWRLYVTVAVAALVPLGAWIGAQPELVAVIRRFTYLAHGGLL
jgi:hypothetical protein